MPIGVGGDAEEAGEDVEYEGEGVSGGELNEGNEGTYCALGGEYRCSLDGDGVRPQAGAANGMAEGGGVDFFVGGRI